MLVLYRTLESRFGDEIEEKLQELVLAHRVVTLNDGEAPEDLPAGTRLPALQEGKQLLTGEAEVRAYVNDLEQEVLYGRQFQSDACYLDPDRPGQCL